MNPFAQYFSNFHQKLRLDSEQGLAENSDNPGANEEPIGRGWSSARSRLRGRYHMALSLNEAREPDCRFYRSAPASRFDALAITIHLSRCNGVPSRVYSRISESASGRPLTEALDPRHRRARGPASSVKSRFFITEVQVDNESRNIWSDRVADRLSGNVLGDGDNDLTALSSSDVPRAR